MRKTSIMSTQPAAAVSTITAVVSAAITLVVAFGVNLSTDQTAAILGFVAIVGPLVSGLITRTKVTPTAQIVDADDPGQD